MKNHEERPCAEQLLHHDWIVRQLQAEMEGVSLYHSDFKPMTAMMSWDQWNL